MLAFYIDEPLVSSEESEVLSVLAARGTKLERLEYRRIPCVFPSANERVTNDRMLSVLRGHIQNAGIPVGVQSIFIVPKDGIRWAVLLQEAFYLVTGFYPMMIQPWQRSASDDSDVVTRRSFLQMIDMHSVMTS